MKDCEDIKKFKILSELVSLCIASVKIEKIIVHQGKGKIYEGIYPPLSLFVYAEKGSLKTTFLREISKVTGHIVMKKVTSAGIVGTIDESGVGLVSPAWDHRRSIALIDEFNVRGESANETKQALLDLTEFGEYSKSIGRVAKKGVHEKDGDLYFKIDRGTIAFKVNTGCIMMTMRKHEHSIFHSALMTRCIPLNYDISDVRKVLNGEIFLNIRNYRVKKEVTIKKKDWDIITNYVLKHIHDPTISIRTCGILAKVYAVKGKHDMKLYELIIALKNDISSVTMEYG